MRALNECSNARTRKRGREDCEPNGNAQTGGRKRERQIEKEEVYNYGTQTDFTGKFSGESS